MSWFALDDRSYDNLKVEAAGNAAWGLYCRCGAWCADKLTDGLVSKRVANRHGTRQQIVRLIDVGLWVETNDGYMMRDYLDYNLSSEQVLLRRDKAVERMRNLRGSVRTNEQRTTSERAPLVRLSPTPTPIEKDDDSVQQGASGSQSSSSDSDWADKIATAAALRLLNARPSAPENPMAWMAATRRGLMVERASDITQAIAQGWTLETAVECLTSSPAPPAGPPPLPAHDPDCLVCDGTGVAVVELPDRLGPCPGVHPESQDSPLISPEPRATGEMAPVTPLFGKRKIGTSELPTSNNGAG